MGAKMTDREELIRLLSLEHRDAISVNQQKILELFDKQQNVIGDDARVYYRFGESEPAFVVHHNKIELCVEKIMDTLSNTERMKQFKILLLNYVKITTHVCLLTDAAEAEKALLDFVRYL
jgi:hypothetical protein